jgi:hypothetical protein
MKIEGLKVTETAEDRLGEVVSVICSIIMWLLIFACCAGIGSLDNKQQQERKQREQAHKEMIDRTIQNLNQKKEERTQIIRVDERTVKICIDGTVVTITSHSHHSAGSHLEYEVSK